MYLQMPAQAPISTQQQPNNRMLNHSTTQPNQLLRKPKICNCQSCYSQTNNECRAVFSFQQNFNVCVQLATSSNINTSTMGYTYFAKDWGGGCRLEENENGGGGGGEATRQKIWRNICVKRFLLLLRSDFRA
jgi:hypothetical protein